MAREKVVDYETVEKEREIAICDECGRALGEDEELVTVALNPQAKERVEEVIEWFDSEDEAEHVARERFVMDSPGEYFMENLHEADFRGHAVAADIRRTTTSLEDAAALLEWCPSCAGDKVAEDRVGAVLSGGSIDRVEFEDADAEVVVYERPYVSVPGLPAGVAGVGLTSMAYLVAFDPVSELAEALLFTGSFFTVFFAAIILIGKHEYEKQEDGP